jgi:hypothetical protein
MKFQILFSILTMVSGFQFQLAPNSPTASSASTRTSETALLGTRREMLESVAPAVFFGLMMPSQAGAEPRPTYLTEPTDEFKQNEAKAMEFKRQQLILKKEFVAAIDKLAGESNNEEALVADIKQIQGLVKKSGGLPLGIKKEELFKSIRTKKAKGYWPTAVEVA